MFSFSTSVFTWPMQNTIFLEVLHKSFSEMYVFSRVVLRLENAIFIEIEWASFFLELHGFERTSALRTCCIYVKSSQRDLPWFKHFIITRVQLFFQRGLFFNKNCKACVASAPLATNCNVNERWYQWRKYTARWKDSWFVCNKILYSARGWILFPKKIGKMQYTR